MTHHAPAAYSPEDNPVVRCLKARLAGAQRSRDHDTLESQVDLCDKLEEAIVEIERLHRALNELGKPQ